MRLVFVFRFEQAAFGFAVIHENLPRRRSPIPAAETLHLPAPLESPPLLAAADRDPPSSCIHAAAVPPPAAELPLLCRSFQLFGSVYSAVISAAWQLRVVQVHAPPQLRVPLLAASRRLAGASRAAALDSPPCINHK